MIEGRIAQFNRVDEPFEIRRVALDGVGPGEVLVKIHRTNVCGSDLHAWHGDFVMRGLGGTLPTVLGHEMVGSVAALGDGVSEDTNGRPLEIGSRVVYPYFYPCHRCRSCLAGRRVSCRHLQMAMLSDATRPPHFVGGYGEYYLLPADAVIYRVPDCLSDEVVSAANCALAQVIHGLDRVGLRFGETVAIQGAGGLGLYATAVAKAYGARRVIVIDGLADRLELAEQFGADATISTGELADPVERVRRVRRLTDGYGADIVAELVGNPTVIPEGIKMLSQGGRYLEIGNINLGKTCLVDPSRLVTANKSIVGVSLYEPDALGRALTFLECAQERLPLDRLAPTTFPLDDINEAFRAADRREVVRASIVP